MYSFLQERCIISNRLNNALFILLIFSCLYSAVSIAQEPMSYEDFKLSVGHDPYGLYIVEGDIPIHSEEQMYRYYEEQYLYYFYPNARHNSLIDNKEEERLNSSLIIHTVNDQDAKWDEQQQSNLTYCVSTSFGERYQEVVEIFEQATVEWEEHADIDFIHLSTYDVNCSDQTQNVLFDVSPAEVGVPYIARAFFPGTSRVFRNVVIADNAFSPFTNGLTLQGILRHELGHVLGFRHEHTRSEAQAPQCYEDNNWRVITEYDSNSVMHYPQCNGTGGFALEITVLDAQGIAMIYGNALNQNTESPQSWSSGQYENNAEMQETLFIELTDYIEVSINGETEKHFDVLSLTYQNGLEHVFDGVLSERFILQGNQLEINFSSDASIRKSGVEVSIKAYEPDGVFIVMGGNADADCPEHYQWLSSIELEYLAMTYHNQLVELLSDQNVKLDDGLSVRKQQESYRILPNQDSSFVLCGASELINEVPMANEEAKVWELINYDNNVEVLQTLSIANATEIDVLVTANTERGFDLLRITSSYLTEEKVYSGYVQQRFRVPGPSIDIMFSSDASVNGGSIRVEVSEVENPTVGDQPQTDAKSVVWSSGRYDNNLDISIPLRVEGAQQLKVMIEGELENGFDFVFIHANQDETLRFTGEIAEQVIMEGDEIVIQLVTDETVQADGITITVIDNDSTLP